MSATKDTFSNYYNRFRKYMESDTKGVEIGVYAVSGILLAVAYHKIRPITKFGKPSDIPKHFIKNKLKQHGVIEAIDPSSSNGTLLLVNHKPPLNFLIPSEKLLAVKLSGVIVNANGYSWLQTVAVGRTIEFIPITTSVDSAECQVFMMCPKNKKNPLDLSEALLSLGFGKMPESQKAINDVEVKKYFNILSRIENNAKGERVGLWSQSLPPQPWAIRKSKDTLKTLVSRVLPANYRLPELVR